MRILEVKRGTKRPAIVAAATALFSRRGIDATSMREVAGAAGVREAAIYRHFRGKEEMAQEIFASWYGWYCLGLQKIVTGPGGTLDKLRQIVGHEFSAVTDHSDAFVYFCENEARFARSLPAEIASVRRVYTAFIRGGQELAQVRQGRPELLADMLSGALCAVALTWHRTGRKKKLGSQLEEVVQACWRMISV
ncbi:MAG TPA: helix-turn-helix domain-containing protein [Candidatus Binataceae bacterium]|nr:helix-turn-helix domain-containing protein [Candidatus Binataceae bacterium]